MILHSDIINKFRCPRPVKKGKKITLKKFADTVDSLFSSIKLSYEKSAKNVYGKVDQ